MYNLYAIIITVFVVCSIFPAYTTVRRIQGIDGSFDPIEQHPDNFEEFLNDL